MTESHRKGDSWGVADAEKTHMIQKAHYGRWLTWAARLGISFWVSLTFFHSPGVNSNDKATFHDMVEGTACRPYVTRALMPWAIRTCVAATPQSMRQAIDKNRVTQYLLHKNYVSKELQWTPPDYFEYVVAFLLSTVCLVAFSRVCELIWLCFFVLGRQYAASFSICALLGLVPLFKYTSYIYDFPSLLFYTLSLYLLAVRRWWVYFPVFMLACVTKETAVLLPIIFSAHFIACRRHDRVRYWMLLAGQGVVFILVRVALAFLYRANPGTAIEFHLTDHNLRVLTTPYPLETAVTWLLIFSLVLHQWPTKPRLLRIAIGMLVPLLGLCFLFGYLDEMRDYYEIYVPTLVLCAISFLRLLGYPVDTTAPTEVSIVGPKQGCSCRG